MTVKKSLTKNKKTLKMKYRKSFLVKPDTLGKRFLSRFSLDDETFSRVSGFGL